MYQAQAKAHHWLTYALALLFLTNDSFALPDDKKQPMQLQANTADLNQQSHIGVYKGNVEVDQGTTHLRASEAITYGDEKNTLIKATLKGNTDAQAHCWTLNTVDKPILHAYADTIHYYPNRHLIELIGHAHVEQGADSFTAPHISYDTERQQVISKNDGESRTTIIIHPEKKP